jgi:hypothetical protein
MNSAHIFASLLGGSLWTNLVQWHWNRKDRQMLVAANENMARVARETSEGWGHSNRLWVESIDDFVAYLNKAGKS